MRGKKNTVSEYLLHSNTSNPPGNAIHQGVASILEVNGLSIMTTNPQLHLC